MKTYMSNMVLFPFLGSSVIKDSVRTHSGLAPRRKSNKMSQNSSVGLSSLRLTS